MTYKKPKAHIIAEIGSNCFKYHTPEQNFKMALMQIHSAKEAGATAVKFQMFTSEELWGHNCKNKSFAKLQNRFALPPHWLHDFKTLCRRLSMDFLCSGFSIQGFRNISPYVNIHKLASPEATSPPLVEYLMKQPKPVIASLGCMRQSILIPFLNKLRPGTDIILECVSEYPASEYDYDLAKMVNLNTQYDMAWGISDHTKGSTLAKYARSFGATYFEKHVDFYLGIGRDTPDSEVSINGQQFVDYVKNIQSVRGIDYDVGKKLSNKLYAHRKSDCGHTSPYRRPEPEYA